MNAKKPKSPLSKFFLPDLWQSKENAYPKSLNNFIRLPKYIIKNFPSFAPDIFTGNVFKLLSFIKNGGIGRKITLEIGRLLFQLIHTPPRTILFVCFYDLINCLLFAHQLKNNPADFSVFFANSLAYLQRHYWKQGKWVATAPLLHGLKILDRMVGILRSFEQSHHIVLINGLTQENKGYQQEKIVYKIKDPSQFFRYMALEPIAVDALSMRQGIVYFRSEKECDRALDILKKGTQSGHSIFSVKKLDFLAHALHYEVILNNVVTKDDFFELNGTEFRCFKYFKPICTLTGSHGEQGVLYSKGIDFDKDITPESFSKFILNYFETPTSQPILKTKQVEYA